ncbi:UDP-glucose--hexose-1-phosphate uridylyltransferase [Massilimicrobiota sp. SW1139]|uniref:UDP-glucose--hexose-1-phosphate uridylyltransferase n=1 Tax=Massilimicrobiota sp. SW1139 TaxID=2530043 RepID=UPI00143B9AB5|nr:UDP-glucose--hexose-1-phosphate uridylyltransferase [Massilimicrobiota sp. SW1139]NJE44334.1 UDP-glucose--hexose-1-phosphate uridylyltransferase [Massilimicrobiota sp. SW1139]
MNTKINQLINYGLENQMISLYDVDYSINMLLDLFKLDCFERTTVEKIDYYLLIEDMLDYAVKVGLIEDNITERDLFDTKIMNCIMPRPSEVVNKFYQLYDENKQKATQYFYDLSIHSNYIRKARTDKNIKFSHYYKYGDIQISINLSKPEKDPKEIAKAKLAKSTGYPKCLLCKENVGYAGNMNHPARQTHRIIPLDLNGKTYNFQYSPYVYYNEHCIIFNNEHVPMVINRQTFENLFTFIEKFPHYMIGSNADLPIVGGSILTHDHYQGGRHRFPMQDASVIKEIEIKGYENIKVQMLNWPLSTLRLTADDKEVLVDLSDKILNHWINYDDVSCDILSHTNDVRHNTVTPIARMDNNRYQIDIVLRNNRTNDEHPLGIFHPHAKHHHIKKENIGLIEVMGLAVLPARLKDELECLKLCLLKKKCIDDLESLKKHKEWFEYLQTLEFDEQSIDEFIEKEVTKKFVSVLENAGVYKMNQKGIEGFTRFVDSLSQ